MSGYDVWYASLDCYQEDLLEETDQELMKQFQLNEKLAKENQRMRSRAGRALYTDKRIDCNFMEMASALKDIELGCRKEKDEQTD